MHLSPCSSVLTPFSRLAMKKRLSCKTNTNKRFYGTLGCGVIETLKNNLYWDIFSPARYAFTV